MAVPFLIMAQPQAPALFKKLEARNIGPAGMSGRVTSIDAVAADPDIIYIATASGGIWKTTSGGTEWEPVGDSMPILNIGAIAIDQQNPAIIWAGTGEGNPRNSQSSGAGLFKSLDGGDTWKLVGLKETKNIHRVIVHPKNSDIVWVGVQGPAWGDNPNRGVYKTIDGGKTWNQVLQGNDSTGIADLVIDPNNPNKLIAAMWQFRRTPHDFTSGGPHSGLYISHDGGDTWVRQNHKVNQLPKGNLGRIGLAIAPSNSNRVYAYIEAKEKNGIYKSNDGGKTWSFVTDKENAGNRPFYYSDIFVDSENENRLYSLWSRLSVSEDAGKNWRIMYSYSKVHPDNHAFYIHPTQPKLLMLGNDGGMAISRNKGQSWQFISNLPVAQYYHINVDQQVPYHIYGGMQDNGSWRGPAYVFKTGGIRNAYFNEVGFGDGFDVMPDPENPNEWVYSMYQGGNLMRFEIFTGNSISIQPTLNDTVDLRFNWNAPLAQDPFNPKKIYYGAQFVFESEDKGDSWKKISDDLTTNDTNFQKQGTSGGLTPDVTGAEMHTTVLSIAPSAAQEGLLWAGTDDGRLWIRKESNATWTEVTKNLPDFPKGAWIPQIRTSTHQPGEAWIVVNDYRRNNWKAYLYHTTDFGKSFERVLDEEDTEGYCLSVYQDPEVPALVFAGTEQGLLVSFDYATTWFKWNYGIPNVSCMDLAFNPDAKDLVIGTFGRSAYILDNVEALRAYSLQNQTFKDSLNLFTPPTAYLYHTGQAVGMRFPGDATFKGQNRSARGRFQYYIATQEDNKKKADFYAVQNSDTLYHWQTTPQNGINTTGWGLSTKGHRMPYSPKKENSDEFANLGMSVTPGTYMIYCVFNDTKDSCKLQVENLPGETFDFALYDIQRERMADFFSYNDSLTAVMDQLRMAKKQLNLITKWIPSDADSTWKPLQDEVKAMQDTLQILEAHIIGDKVDKGLVYLTDDIKAYRSKAWGAAYTEVKSNQAYHNAMQQYKRLTLPGYKQAVVFLENDWVSFQDRINDTHWTPFIETK